MQRIEIVGERRREHDAAFRAMVVEQAGQPGGRVQDGAWRHGICSSLIYRWRDVPRCRRRAQDRRYSWCRSEWPSPGQMRGLPRVCRHRHRAPTRPGLPRSALIEIEFEGGSRVWVDGDVSLAALRRVVAAPCR